VELRIEREEDSLLLAIKRYLFILLNK